MAWELQWDTLHAPNQVLKRPKGSLLSLTNNYCKYITHVLRSARMVLDRENACASCINKYAFILSFKEIQCVVNCNKLACEKNCCTCVCLLKKYVELKELLKSCTKRFKCQSTTQKYHRIGTPRKKTSQQKLYIILVIRCIAQTSLLHKVKIRL